MGQADWSALRLYQAATFTLSLTLCIFIGSLLLINSPAYPYFSLKASTVLKQNIPIRNNRPDFTWREVFASHVSSFYVYSIYSVVGLTASTELHVVVLASGDVWDKTNCSFRFYDPFSSRVDDDIVINGTFILEKLPESHDEDGTSINMAAGRLRLGLPETTINMTHVDVYCRHNVYGYSGTVTYSIPAVTTKEPANLTFAHCGLIYGLYNENQAAVVEFIEYYRLMGVSKFYWNGLAVGERTMEVLRYYEKKGIMQFTNWILPFNETSGKSVHYHGQVAMQYDCMLKTATNYDYTVMSDLDEYFATSLQPATFASIVHNGTSDCATVRSDFMDKNATYSDTFDPQSGLPLLRTATVTQRTNWVNPVSIRSKYVCRMRTVDLPMIHLVNRFKIYAEGGTLMVEQTSPEPEETLLLHFRREDGATVAATEEFRAAQLAPQLSVNVHKPDGRTDGRIPQRVPTFEFHDKQTYEARRNFHLQIVKVERPPELYKGVSAWFMRGTDGRTDPHAHFYSACSSDVHYHSQRSKYVCRVRTIPAGMPMIHMVQAFKRDKGRLGPLCYITNTKQRRE
ncbi:hypothetical protein BV898_15345 [Hypsibius exemplaris]|uniref:Glycosyltransferase family 92 protein n=1 Tax=Hypsibius exemplaris TaxID=2072580 RepID=A0A9X6RKB9_HYPEX|nr:hypothetical protein BV898_15345 [Hypsibius exemplaris]